MVAKVKFLCFKKVPAGFEVAGNFSFNECTLLMGDNH